MGLERAGRVAMRKSLSLRPRALRRPDAQEVGTLEGARRAG